MSTKTILLALLAAGWLAACRTTTEVDDMGDAGTGNGDTSASLLLGTDGIGSADASADSDTDGDSDTVPCEDSDLPFAIDPVKVMILQDFSSSMDGINWTNVNGALVQIFNAWKGKQIELGMDIFSDNGNCGVDKLQYDTSPDPAHVDAIIAWLNQQGPNAPVGNTPLYGAMNNYASASWAPSFHDKTYPSYLLIISDGADTCMSPSNAALGTLAADLRDNQGIKTFTVGFSSGAPAVLDVISANGGTGINSHIPATDQASLLAAFDQIAGTIVSCTCPVDTSNPAINPNDVNFYFDSVVVPFNPDCNTTPPGLNVGWRWTDSTHTAIELCVDTCALLRTGQVATVSATYGCPSVTSP